MARQLTIVGDDDQPAAPKQTAAQSEPPVGDDQTSLAYWVRIAEISPSNLGAHSQIGHLHLKAGDFEEARAAYQRAQAIRPGHPPSLIGLARVAEQLGEYEEALSHLLPLLQQHPEHAEAALLASRLLADFDRKEEAEAVLARAVAKRDNHVGLLTALARVAATSDHRERALRCWVRVLSIEARNFHAAFQAGRLLLELRRPSEAEQMLRIATSLQPDYRGAHVSLAQALYALGRDEQALAAWDAALALGGDTVPARVQRAGVLIDLDRAHQALDSLREMREQAPDNRQIVRQMARGEERAERWQVALAHWQSLLGNDPGNREARDHIFLCRALIDRDAVIRELPQPGGKPPGKPRKGLFSRER
jgi:tetratricopeptide (TPR) repeat protein